MAKGHFAPANLFGDKRHRALVIAGFICSCSGRVMSTNVAKCIQKYTNVYVCRANFRFFGTLLCVLSNSSSPSLMDTGRTFWGHFAAFQLTAFAFKFSLGESSGYSTLCASNVHNVGPPCGRTRGTFSIQAAFRALVRIRCNYPGAGRPKSTQVDVSRRKSTGFLFFGLFS